MTVLEIDVTKINKSRLKEVTFKNGHVAKFLKIALVPNKEGKDQYGNDGFVRIDLPREARDAGEKGEIVGNYKEIGGGKAHSPPRRQPQQPPEDDYAF